MKQKVTFSLPDLKKAPYKQKGKAGVNSAQKQPENCTQAANMSKITADYPPPTHPKHPEKPLPHGCRQRPAIISQSRSFSFPFTFRQFGSL
jgi:hypothetical protein